MRCCAASSSDSSRKRPRSLPSKRWLSGASLDLAMPLSLSEVRTQEAVDKVDRLGLWRLSKMVTVTHSPGPSHGCREPAGSTHRPRPPALAPSQEPLEVLSRRHQQGFRIDLIETPQPEPSHPVPRFSREILGRGWTFLSLRPTIMRPPVGKEPLLPMRGQLFKTEGDHSTSRFML